jgi:type I restriction enzyme S subunit
MNNGLPEGWTKTRLGEVAESITYGYTAKAATTAKGPRYLRITDIQNNSVDWASVPPCSIAAKRVPAYQLRSGDLVFARTGATTGKSFLINSCPEAVFASYLIRVRPATSLVPEFIARYFQSSSYWNQISENISGSAQPNCNATKLSSLIVPIPPLPEQRRIVAKLEKLFGQLDACQHRLAKLPTLLKRFRQSVLAAACSGRLTADWREEISTKVTEDAEDLPDGWSPSSVGDVLESLKYGTATKCDYKSRGAPVLRIPNVVSGKIDQTDLKFANLPPKELNQLRLMPGDILLIRSNGSVSLVGRSAIVGEGQKGFAYAGYLIRLRPNRTRIEPEFLNLVLATYDVRLQIELEARSTSGVNNINTEEVQALHFLLPPQAEQQEIVRRVEKLFALADRIEARFAEGQKRVDGITQAILAKAFRGELVPTEFELAKAEGRSFESAEELLTRIHTASDARLSGNGSKPRKQRSQSK